MSSDVPVAVSNSTHIASSTENHGGFREGEILVKFKQETRSASALRIHQSIGSTVMKKIQGVSGLEHVKLDPSTTVADAVAYYKSNPEVEYAEPNYRRRAAVIPNDPGFNLQWGLTKINAPSAWDISTGGNVVIAVPDTGINYNHSDISANIWSNSSEIPGNGIDDDGNGYVDDIRGWNFVSSNNSPMDDNDHGTHVAGIIGAVGNNQIGIAGTMWNCKLMPLKILDSEGNGYISDEVSAIYYAIAKGVKIINFSLTGADYSLTEYNAINAAKNAGILVVAAAGNESSNNDVIPQYPANYGLQNIISVASSNSSDTLSSFSNYGTSVHVAAPGSSIYSAIPSGYGYMSGTSMATPHVSGLAGLLFGYYTNYTYSQVRSTILNYSDILPSLSGRVQTSGRINAYLSLSSLAAPSGLAAAPLSLTQIQLNWTDRATAEDGYKIERKNGSGQYQGIATLPSNAASYTDTPPIDGTTYDYRVYAYNSVSGAPGGPAATVSATTPLLSPSNLSASASSSSQISLSWTDNSGAESGYKIERKTGSGNFAEIASTTANSVSYQDSGLSPSTTYTYRIRAFNSAAGDSSYSNETIATTQAPPASSGGGGGGCSINPSAKSPADVSLPVILAAVMAVMIIRRNSKK
jgi:subtilisin family serine protease